MYRVGNAEHLHSVMLKGDEFGTAMVDGARDFALFPTSSLHVGEVCELRTKLIGGPWLFWKGGVVVCARQFGSNLVLDVFGCRGYLLVNLSSDAWSPKEEAVCALVEGVVEDKEGPNEAMAAEEVERLPRYS